MRKTNVAIVGFGYWGPQLARNLVKQENANLSYICDIDKKNLTKAEKSYPGATVALDYKKALADKKLDAIIVATPANTHFKIAKESLLARKHVLVEKPFTSKITEGEELVKLADVVDKKIMVSFPFVYSESVEYIKKLIRSKSLGEIYYLESIRVNLSPIRSDSGVIADLAIHDFSILEYILNDRLISVRTIGSAPVKKLHVEMAHIYLKYKSGFTAHISVSWLSPLKIRSMTIGGEKQMIVFNDVEPSEKIRIFDRGADFAENTISPFTPLYRSGDITIPYLEQIEPLATELNHFILSIQTNKNPKTSGKRALKIMQIIEAVNKSLASGKEEFLD